MRKKADASYRYSASLKTKLFLCVGVLSFVLLVSSCKKTEIQVDQKTQGSIDQRTQGSSEDKIKDSIYLYTKELYYWNSSLPTYESFAPRSYASKEALLDGIKRIAINPLTRSPYDKYSFYDNSSAGSVSVSPEALSILEGTTTDFGMSLGYVSNRRAFVVCFVYEGSPAAKAKIERGDLITEFSGANGSSDIDEVLKQQRITIKVEKRDGLVINITLDKASYVVNPVIANKVFTTTNGKRVGYLMFSTFNKNGKEKLGEAFALLRQQNISELIVDLRYNGGGYVSVAEYMLNTLVPASEAGTVMTKKYYNSYLVNLTNDQRKSSILLKQPLLGADGKRIKSSEYLNGQYATYADLNYRITTNSDNLTLFSKDSDVVPLNINQVYFLVTGNTASASELVVNSLEPTSLKPKLIGSQTYGKPVGFFPIRISTFDLYIPEFESKNRDGEGGYYDGIGVDKVAVDDITNDFNENESMIKEALYYAANGRFSSSSSSYLFLSVMPPAESRRTASPNAIERKSARNFYGLIDDQPLKAK